MWGDVGRCEEIYGDIGVVVADHVAPSWRAWTTRLEREERGAAHRTSPPETKLAATWTPLLPPLPKPHCSAAPVGAKLPPRSEMVRGRGEATSTKWGDTSDSRGGRSGS